MKFEDFQSFFSIFSPIHSWRLGDCDFDNGLCKDWRNDVTGDFQWSIGSGSTPSLLTGPDGDRSDKGAFWLSREHFNAVAMSLASALTRGIHPLKILKLANVQEHGECIVTTNH